MVEDTAESGRTKTTTDHDTIRNWVEERGSTAARTVENEVIETGRVTKEVLLVDIY